MPLKDNGRMLYGLKQENIDHINSIFRNFPQIDKAIIYGSRVKGNYKEASDIDITLIGNDLDLKTLNKISFQLDDLMLPYTFDISIFKHISNPDLVDHINSIGKVLYIK